MISCEQCQKKLVAIYDNEGGKGDVELANDHLKDCPACRVFRDDMVGLRQQFTSVEVPGFSKSVDNELMQVIRTDSLRRENRLNNDRSKQRPLLLRLPRVAWISGLAGLFLLIVSWLACFTLVKEVSDLRGRLEASGQELTTVRQELAVTKAAKQLEESRDKEQKAITALYLRMAELESRVERYSSPRTTFLQTESYRFPDRQGDM